MGFETKVLAVVKSVTSVDAYFYNGTMFLETADSKVATEVFDALNDNFGYDTGIAFGKVGACETSYDFM